MRGYAFLVLLAGILILPNLTWSQGPGGRGSGGGGMKRDPDALFNKLSKGKDTIVVSELDARGKSAVEKMGLTGDRITRDQFRAAMQKGVSAFAPGGPPGIAVASGGDRISRIAENAFRKYDKNSDGTLSSDEMPEDLLRERDKYDTNKDGFISLEEFKVYMADKMGASDPNNQGNPAAYPMNFQPTQPVEEARPTIYRAGKLPKELPEWFVKLDRDGDNDGQVGLDEWRRSGKPLAEFKIYDLNGDGLITAEEFLKYTAIAKKKAGGDSPTAVVSNIQVPAVDYPAVGGYSAVGVAAQPGPPADLSLPAGLLPGAPPIPPDFPPPSFSGPGKFPGGIPGKGPGGDLRGKPPNIAPPDSGQRPRRKPGSSGN